MTKPHAPLAGMIVAALLMEAAYASIHLARSAQEQIALVLLVYVIAGAAYCMVLWRLRSAGQWVPPRGTWAVAIGAALVFRLTLLPLHPRTSSDTNRYLWEGLVQTQGVNPYVFPPNAPQLATTADRHASVYREVNHSDVASIYPPFAQLLFRLNASLAGASLMGWKLILLVFDAVLAIAVWWVLRCRGMETIGGIAVRWCPLLLLESYECGHLDLVGVALLAVAIAAMERGRWAASAAMVALSINVKYLWPALAVPLLAVRAADRQRMLAFLGLVATTVVACWLPYHEGIPHALATARTFAETWTFNDPIFELLRAIPGPHWLPMAFVLAGLSALAALLIRRRSVDPWLDTWLLSATALLVSPVAYPWYFLWVVPALATRPRWWLIAWPLAVAVLHLLVGYRHMLTGRWDAMPWASVPIAAIVGIRLGHMWLRRLSVPSSPARQSYATGDRDGSCARCLNVRQVEKSQ